MATWFCEQCGTENDENFCMRCGKPKPAAEISKNVPASGNTVGYALLAFLLAAGIGYMGIQIYGQFAVDSPDTGINNPTRNLQEAIGLSKSPQAQTPEKTEGVVLPTPTTDVNTMPPSEKTEPTQTGSNTNVVATYFVVNCKEWITLRSAPSTSASALERIPLGQAVGYIEDAGNGFYKINYDGVVGYAAASYLSTNKPTSTRRKAKVVNCKEWITLRQTPSTSAASLARIPLGSYVSYISNASDGFYCIEYNGMRGYALQAYLELK